METSDSPSNSTAPQPTETGPPGIDVLHNPPVIPVGAQAGAEPQVVRPQEPAQNPDSSLTQSEMPVRPKRTKKTIAAILIAIGLLIGGGVLIALSRSFGSLKLVPHETDSTYFLVPESYNQVPQESGQRFDEPDDDPNTRSSIIYVYQPYTGDFTVEEKDAFVEMFRSQLPSFIESFADNEGENIENVTTERLVTEEKNAVRARATLANGQSQADFDMIVIFGNQGVYALAVAAHESDAKLKEANNAIINSLTVWD